MKLPSYKWIVFVVLIFIIHIGAGFSEYKLVFQEDHFLLEGIYHVLETDLDNDGSTEALLAGKNYVGREMFMYWLIEGPLHQPTIKWQSPNLFEDRSYLWITTGKFTNSQNQLLACTDSQIYLYQYENNSLNLIKQEKHPFAPVNFTSGDLNGDGFNEFVVAKIGKITNRIYNDLVQVWQLKEGKFQLVAETGLVGNIRSLTAGDIDGDGKEEIIMEEGYLTGSGNIHIFALNDQKISERFSLRKAVPGAIYALRVKNFPAGVRLLTASGQGKIKSFVWQNNALIPIAGEISLGCELVDFAAIGLNKDQNPALWVAGYPARLMILTE